MFFNYVPKTLTLPRTLFNTPNFKPAGCGSPWKPHRSWKSQHGSWAAKARHTWVYLEMGGCCNVWGPGLRAPIRSMSGIEVCGAPLIENLELLRFLCRWGHLGLKKSEAETPLLQALSSSRRHFRNPTSCVQC